MTSYLLEMEIIWWRLSCYIIFTNICLDCWKDGSKMLQGGRNFVSQHLPRGNIILKNGIDFKGKKIKKLVLVPLSYGYFHLYSCDTKTLIFQSMSEAQLRLNNLQSSFIWYSFHLTGFILHFKVISIFVGKILLSRPIASKIHNWFIITWIEACHTLLES